MKKIILIVILTIAALNVQADGFGYVKFNMADGTETPFAADGLKITFVDGNAVLTLADGTVSTLNLDNINYFYFTDDPGTVTGLKGDVNNDGEVGIADITALINLLLSDEQITDAGLFYRADVNNDNEISIADVTALVNLVLTQ